MGETPMLAAAAVRARWIGDPSRPAQFLTPRHPEPMPSSRIPIALPFNTHPSSG